MDVARLVREEWSLMLLLVTGLGGMLLAVSRGEWVWGVISAALVVACLEILQLRGWILQEGFI